MEDEKSWESVIGNWKLLTSRMHQLQRSMPSLDVDDIVRVRPALAGEVLE